MSLKITVDKLDAVLASIRSLTRNECLVGIPSSTAGDTTAPINNAAIGYIQENGSPATNLPPRPFLLPGVASVKDQAAAILGNGARAALDGNTKAADQALDRVGLVAAAAVKTTITSKIPPQIAVSTAIGRLTRTATGRAKYNKATPEQKSSMIEGMIATATPLVDTGSLLASITYVVRKK